MWSYPGALFLSAGGYHHHLGTNTWAKGAARATDTDARLLEWEIIVPTRKDAEEAARHVKESGYEVKQDNGAPPCDWYRSETRKVTRSSGSLSHA